MSGIDESRTAERIARLCRELDAGLEEVTVDLGAGDALARLLTELRRDGEPATLRVCFDELDEELRRGGVPGGLGGHGSRSGDYVALSARGGAVEEVFACPSQTCARAEAVLDIHARPPRCGVYREPMRRVRLDR